MDETYRVSPRVLLTRGDKIRLSGGPRWRGSSGTMHFMGVRGEGIFQGFARDPIGNGVVYVHQKSILHCLVVDRVTPVEPDDGTPRMIYEPYRITRKRK